MKVTSSFCPECYKRIPANVEIGEQVIMKKKCEDHGSFDAVVENDPSFYIKCLISQSHSIYNGFFIDVTSKCDRGCKYCYYQVDNNADDPSVADIVDQARLMAQLSPIILTGGEPTLRLDLPDVIHEIQKITPMVELVTNGNGFDWEMLDAVSKLLTMNKDGMTTINLSMHKESEGKDAEVVEMMSEKDLKLESALFVIDDLKDIDEAIEYSLDNRDVIQAIRIKAATNLWAESGAQGKIFVSDMLHYISKHWDAMAQWWRGNTTSFFNIEIDQLPIMLVSWYDVYNIDCNDINIPPFYRARTGEIANIVTANIINEGLMKGWLYGRKVEQCLRTTEAT